MVEQETPEEREVRVPPYYERFLEERDRRLSSEFARLETEIRHNRQRLDGLKADIARLNDEIADVRTELKGDIAGLRTELKGDIAGLRTELKADMARLDSKLDSHFRWTLTLLLPIILGVVALLVQNLLK